MGDTTLDETCPDCGCQLVRTTEDVEQNPHDHPVISCPGCLEIKRHEDE